MQDATTFYQNHLDRVSRSFAFCIARLQSPLREQVGLSYLICRILDTVEDAAWPTRAVQIEQFEKFEALLLEKFTDDELQNWLSRFPAGLPDGEQLLLNDAGRIFKDFQALPKPVRKAIAEPVLSMSRGMSHFTLSRSKGELRLKTLREVDQYCFFVAGVVGEILTRLVALVRGTLKIEEHELVDAFHFGLFLQKINLLKDQRTDEAQGRYLVHSRPEVVASLREHATRAIEYITAIPKSLLSFRLFCSWSLFLGLASLPWIEQGWENQDFAKIPRSETQKLLAEVEAVVGDDDRLKQMFEFLISVSGAATAPWSGAYQGDVQTTGAGFPALYRGLLSEIQLRKFGLV